MTNKIIFDYRVYIKPNILAMIYSAVVLGNIWRYPYVLYSNGGEVFYIPTL